MCMLTSFAKSRNAEDRVFSTDLHLQAYSLDGVSESLKKAYKLFTDGKFSNALQAFNQMLWTIPLVVVASRKEVDEVKELVIICRSVTAASHCCFNWRLQYATILVGR